MTPLVLFLPWPPSVNRYWRSPTRHDARRIISAEGRQYREAVRAAILEQLHTYPKPLQGGVQVHLWACPPDRRRRDLDNLPKAVFDACTHSRVWGDDSQIQRLTIEWATMAVPDNGPVVQGVAFPIKPGSICLHISPLP